MAGWHNRIYGHQFVSMSAVQFSSVQSLSCVQLFVTPWTATHQASLSITNSQGLLKLLSIESNKAMATHYSTLAWKLP